MSWDQTEHSQSPCGQAEVWEAWVGVQLRKEPFLLWVLRMCGPLEDSSRWLALTLSVGWGPLFRLPPDSNLPRVKCGWH